jgi:hypothetical protein
VADPTGSFGHYRVINSWHLRRCLPAIPLRRGSKERGYEVANNGNNGKQRVANIDLAMVRSIVALLLAIAGFLAGR